MSFIVYALRAPGGEVVYIGTTEKTPAHRLQGHIHQAKHGNTRKDEWVRGLLARGLAPQIDVQETVAEPYTAGAIAAGEARWIGIHVLAGRVLFNQHNVEMGLALAGIESPTISAAGRRLYRVMYDRRVTMVEVASAVEVSPVTVSNWLTGVSVPYAGARERLAAWLGDALPIDTFRPADYRGEKGKAHEVTTWGRRDAVEAARAVRRVAAPVRASRRSARATGGAS